MDAVYYRRILEKGLLPAATDAFGVVWTLQHENAPIYNAPHTKNWLDAHDVNVLEWPSVSPDLNIIENVWRMLFRLVYKNGATYETVEQLIDAIFKCWHDIDLSIIQILYNSIPRRCIAAIEKKGASIGY